MVQPIKRSEFAPRFWDTTIEAFNELIKEKNTLPVKITQTEVVNKILNKLHFDHERDSIATTRAKIFETHQLDIEDLYRAQGWDVTFDQPAYCETYEPYWIFK